MMKSLLRTRAQCCTFTRALCNTLKEFILDACSTRLSSSDQKRKINICLHVHYLILRVVAVKLLIIWIFVKRTTIIDIQQLSLSQTHTHTICITNKQAPRLNNARLLASSRSSALATSRYACQQSKTKIQSANINTTCAQSFKMFGFALVSWIWCNM